MQIYTSINRLFYSKNVALVTGFNLTFINLHKKCFLEPPTSEYFDEWAFLTWSLLSIINRLQRDTEDALSFLDYGGKHFQVSFLDKIFRLKN
jgi:hypothetical protein